jgi:DNA repair protein RadC
MGRAARNDHGKVIMYADTVTGSMQRAIDETTRRRTLQEKYNKEHGIVPKTIIKEVSDLLEISKDDDAARLLTIASALSARRICDGFKFGISHTDAEIHDYIVASFRGVYTETVYAMLFDGAMRPISYEFINEGTANYSDVVPMKLLEKASRKGAKAVIIAHNHPLGDPTPSAEDFSSTLVIKSLFDKAGIQLLSHFIVSGNKAGKITPEMLSLRID